MCVLSSASAGDVKWQKMGTRVKFWQSKMFHQSLRQTIPEPKRDLGEIAASWIIEIMRLKELFEDERCMEGGMWKSGAEDLET